LIFLMEITHSSKFNSFSHLHLMTSFIRYQKQSSAV
jgi:hypothetical protein